MEDLKILSEITTRYGTRNINELEFKTPEDFAAYKKKHKMRPGTVVKVAGKDKVIDYKLTKDDKKLNSDINVLSRRFDDGDVKLSPKEVNNFAKNNNIDTYDLIKWTDEADTHKEVQDQAETFSKAVKGDKEALEDIKRGIDTLSQKTDDYGDEDKPKKDDKKPKKDDKIDSRNDTNPELDKLSNRFNDVGVKLSSKEINNFAKTNNIDTDDLVNWIDDSYSTKDLQDRAETLSKAMKGDKEALEDVEGEIDIVSQKIDNYNDPFYNPYENFDLKQLSKITTRYTNRLDEAMKMKGANGKMVEVPSEYGRIMSGIDRLMSKFNPRGVMFGYRSYHKLKPNDEYSGSIILKNPLSKKDIDVVMKHLKSAGSSLGVKFEKITFNPDRNEPFVEFRIDDDSLIVR